MEDEQGDVGRDSSGGVSESHLSGDLPSETLVENMGTESRVEESCEEGDGEEIMVEVVGSDVFVHGVSGQKEGDFGSGEAEDLEGQVWENRKEPEGQNSSDAVNVANDGDGNKMGESELGFSESRDEKSSIVIEEVNIKFSESADVVGGEDSALPSRGPGVSGDEVWNPGIEPMVVSSSAATELVSVQTEEVTETTPMVTSEEETVEDKAVDEDSAEVVTTEPLNQHVETVIEGEVGTVEKEEVLPSTDNSASHDHLGADAGTSHCETNATHDVEGAPSEVSHNSNCEGPENVQVDVIGGGVGEAGLVNASASGELLVTSRPDGSLVANAERDSTGDDDAIEAKITDDKEIFASESKESILKANELASDVEDKNQVRLNEFDGTKVESNHGIEGVSHVSPEPINEKSLVSERVEAIGSVFDDVLDFKDESLNIDPPDLTTVGNDECLKTDENSETDVVHQKHGFSNEPTQLADGGDTAEVKKGEGLNVEIQDDTEENQPNTMSSSCPGDEEIVQADSGMCREQPVMATTMGEVVDTKVAITQAKVVDGDVSSEKGQDIDSEISKQSLECQIIAENPALDASAEDMHLSTEVACSKAETADVVMTEADVSCNIPVVHAEVGFDNVVEGCGSPESKPEQAAVLITDTSNYEVDKLDTINIMANEVSGTAAGSDITQVNISPDLTDKIEFHVSTANISLVDGGEVDKDSVFDIATFSDEVDGSREADDNSIKNNGFYSVEDHDSETKLMDVEEERESDRTYHGGKEVDSELATQEPDSETDKLRLSNEEKVKPASLLRMNQSGYLSPPENEGRFAVSDLVWGKVRSHPWWPGQIFDPADASEKAVKYYKKDSYLVAYFGDRTFAWNDASLLKPFGSHFSQIEKQSNSEAFQDAVNCALEEVSRRVELGLACSCIPKDAYNKIETQVVDNTGIREESSRRYGVDQSSEASNFEPDKLLEYIRDLAPRASFGADRLDLVIAQAQLSAFCRFKGYRLPTEFPPAGELLENDAETEQMSDEMVASHKHKHTPKDGPQSRKERSLTELMGEREYSPEAES
ncbi:UNVERIFIED_CONTAM: hypothetical protein Slati_4273700 [Sesamum latifolium]|uniref:PWWP domain-containing protein n=1 Tax=Sesamum latifolium TaxID=2727402 RepID=A0AAW2TE48_9LAMI